MTREEHCWRNATQVILTAVEERLIAAGALVELRQFHRLSAQETDVLIWQEIHGCPSYAEQVSDDEVAA